MCAHHSRGDLQMGLIEVLCHPELAVDPTPTDIA
jgi:hypothetical protein